MEYSENANNELKEIFTDNIRKEIIAFLNSNGGDIYVGVSDDGKIIGIDRKKHDEYDGIISSWIRDVIAPNTSSLVKFSFDKNDVMHIKVAQGTEKPYYLISKGPISSGTFVRIGRSTRQATKDEILNMIIESRDFSFESYKSLKQDLNFTQLNTIVRNTNFKFNTLKYITLGIKNNESEYSNLGLLLSDENPYYVKFAVYQGNNRVTFLDKKEFKGSIVNIAKEILSFLDVINSKYIEIVKHRPERLERRSYPEVAIREIIFNAICHTDYTRPAQIKIEFFDDRLEISSPGNIYGGIPLEIILTGRQSIRNPKLINLLDKLGMIENYGTGLQRTLEAYEEFTFKPKLDVNAYFFSVILPNINYHLKNNQETTKKQPRNNQEIDVIILELITKNPNITRNEIKKETGFPEGSIRHHIEKLKKQNKIARVGSTKTGYWKIR